MLARWVLGSLDCIDLLISWIHEPQARNRSEQVDEIMKYLELLEHRWLVT